MQKGASIGGGGLILNWEDFCLLGDTWQSLEVFRCHNWGWGYADCIERVESRDAAKHPAKHRTAPPPPSTPRQRLIHPQMFSVPRLRDPGVKVIKDNSFLPLAVIFQLSPNELYINFGFRGEKMFKERKISFPFK